ncbi:MAG: anthranilate synthase component I family protein, partial [Planctomycetota bacterium]
MSTFADAAPTAEVWTSELSSALSVIDYARRLHGRPGMLWFDSATGGTLQVSDQMLDRYSFLTSDPIDRIQIDLENCGQDEGDFEACWDMLERRVNQLPPRDRSLPPMQGGWAGLIGYEAGCLLEPVEPALVDDLPTPVIDLALYDWCLAIDHRDETMTVIVRNVDGTTDGPRRMQEVLAWLSNETPLVGNAGEIRPTRNESRDRVRSNFAVGDFSNSVQGIVDRICRGDSFQVNLAQRLLCESDLPSFEIYESLRRANPAPFAVWLSSQFRNRPYEILSSSPEGFLNVRDRRVITRPIKGTVERLGDDDDARRGEQLIASEKDRAENVMIVDLMRNDLSRVCDDGSVRVTKLCGLEQYQHVQHLVSVVEGVLRSDENVVSMMRSCFPGGSITGAPKVEAMRTIAELEPHRRGAYCGSMGYFSSPHDGDWNILIRT